MEEFKYIVFRLGDQKYAINLMFISSIEQDYSLIPVPNAPKDIIGIINLRGSVIPVYSLKSRFGMVDDVPRSGKSLLVANCFGDIVAYEVDAVEGIEAMDPSLINRMPSIASNEETNFMEEVLHINDSIVIAISVDEVLTDDVKAELNKIVESQS